jgi:hypothetical protein
MVLLLRRCCPRGRAAPGLACSGSASVPAVAAASASQRPSRRSCIGPASAVVIRELVAAPRDELLLARPGTCAKKFWPRQDRPLAPRRSELPGRLQVLLAPPRWGQKKLAWARWDQIEFGGWGRDRLPRTGCGAGSRVGCGSGSRVGCGSGSGVGCGAGPASAVARVPHRLWRGSRIGYGAGPGSAVAPGPASASAVARVPHRLWCRIMRLWHRVPHRSRVNFRSGVSHWSRWSHQPLLTRCHKAPDGHPGGCEATFHGFRSLITDFRFANRI